MVFLEKGSKAPQRIWGLAQIAKSPKQASTGKVPGRKELGDNIGVCLLQADSNMNAKI